MLSEKIEQYQRSLEEQGVGQLEIAYMTMKFISKPPDGSLRRWISKSWVRRRFVKKEKEIIKDMCFVDSIRKKLLSIYIDDLRNYQEESFHISFMSDFISQIYENMEDKESLLEDLRDIIRPEF